MAKLKKGRGPSRLFGRKADEDEGFDIITEAKEPFSFANFFETQVMGRAKRFKELLADKGILFFLMSPFMARSRLVAQLLVLCLGIAFGVIPRASSLMTDMQNQAFASEISGLSDKSVGGLSITPAASSNYKGMHMLAFILAGDDLPSSASKYEVHMARAYGSSDWKDVAYAWDIYPMADGQHILLVAIDQTRQKSGYGAFQLYIQLAGDKVESYSKAPFEIVLSVAQETTGLYNKTGVHLSELSETICGTGSISGKLEEFEEAIEKYRVVLERAQAMPVDIAIYPSAEELEAECLANRIYRALEDDSTTADVAAIPKVYEPPEIEMDTVLESDGITYDSEFVSALEDSGDISDEDAAIISMFEEIDSAKTAAISAMNNVNSSAVSWYSMLEPYKLVLNQPVQADSFKYFAKCTDTVEDEIAFIDASEFGPVAEAGGQDPNSEETDSEEMDKKTSKKNSSRSEEDTYQEEDAYDEGLADERQGTSSKSSRSGIEKGGDNE